MRSILVMAFLTLGVSGASAASQAMMPASGGPAQMMNSATLVIHHKVADYAKWRPVYDADEPNRTKAGLTNCRVRRSLDDNNDVVIACAMADPAKAKVFTASKTLTATMTKAGVEGKPEFLYLSPPQ